MSDSPAIAILDEVGEDVILARVADGETIGTLGRTYGVSRRTFYNWINAEPGRRKKLNEAKALAAEKLVEDADRIAEEATPLTANVATLQIKQKLFKAGKLAPDEWGEKPAQISVGVNLGDLHLDALRQLGNRKPAEIPVAEFKELPGAEA